jgi:hypothetical protein
MAQNPLIGKVGDKLDLYLNQLSRRYQQSLFYDENAKKLNLPTIIDPRQLEQILETSTYSEGFGQSLFEKFFDLSMGRAARYSEYEQIINRIPEAAQAINIYVDSIMAPNVGPTDNQILIDTKKHSDSAEKAKDLIKVILDRTNFFQLLPQIVYTALVYGDSFVELDPTSNGVRYIIHQPQKCTLVYDKKTDIEMGLIVQLDMQESKLADMLSYAYPQIRLEVPQRMVSVVSDKQYMFTKENKYEVAHIENQMTELIEDVMRDRGVKFKYLAPNRYVRFPIYYNNQYYPYGTSLLDAARSISKQLLLIEAALAIYRATRTPLRTKWTLEVGSIPPDQIPGIMKSVMSKFRRQRVLNTDGTSNGTTIDSIPEFMGVEEDIWTSSIDGVDNLKLENLQNGDITPFTNDADYFRKKLLSSLGIPPSYLAEEQGGSTRALLTLEDIRFSRTIRKLQTDINNSLQDLINYCFLLINMPQYVDMVNIALPDPSTIETNMKVENLSNRLSVAGNFMESFPNIPKLWVLKNLLGFKDEEIDEMEDSVADQKGMKILAEQIPGTLNSEVESGGLGGGGLGGGLDLGGDIGDLGMGDETGSTESTANGPMGSVDLDNLGSDGEENGTELTTEEETATNV